MSASLPSVRVRCPVPGCSRRLRSLRGLANHLRAGGFRGEALHEKEYARVRLLAEERRLTKDREYRQRRWMRVVGLFRPFPITRRAQEAGGIRPDGPRYPDPPQQAADSFETTNEEDALATQAQQRRETGRLASRMSDRGRSQSEEPSAPRSTGESDLPEGEVFGRGEDPDPEEVGNGRSAVLPVGQCSAVALHTQPSR